MYWPPPDASSRKRLVPPSRPLPRERPASDDGRPRLAASRHQDAAPCSPSPTTIPPIRHETTFEIAIDPETVRADLVERIATSTGAKIGPASIDHIIVATDDAKLAIHLGADQDFAEIVPPIATRFDARDDHGGGTRCWAPDALLSTVIGNEVERVWRLYGAEECLSRALAIRD